MRRLCALLAGMSIKARLPLNASLLAVSLLTHVSIKHFLGVCNYKYFCFNREIKCTTVHGLL